MDHFNPIGTVPKWVKMIQINQSPKDRIDNCSNKGHNESVVIDIDNRYHLSAKEATLW